ncbi:hypothetical protein M3Y95_00873000 [Aphelenchoides besseyi]|nr:hypothetical protein M3Y95_00873000 [Aphelenchoides besseyi]
MVKRRVEMAPQRSTITQHTVEESKSTDEESSVPTQKRAKFSIHDLLHQQSSQVKSSTEPALQFCPSTSSPSTGVPTSSIDEETEEIRTATDSPVSTNDVENLQNADSTASHQLAVNWTPAGDSPTLANVRCVLESRELWSKFHKLQTEMIITKSGRRMFPTVKARLEGCDADSFYYVFLDVIPVDAKRYRYVYNKSAWLAAGKAEPSPRCRVYMHPDSPFTGRQLSSQVISFEKAKLTNNEIDRNAHLVLNSMHKYQPRVHVVRRDRQARQLDGNATDFDLTNEEYKTFHFEETRFMAVTAYQNQLVGSENWKPITIDCPQITKLKIEKNPFAKGFRDPTGRGNDLGDLSRQLENLPQHPAAALFLPSLLSSGSIGGLPPNLSAPFFDPTNLSKLLASSPPFSLSSMLMPSISSAENLSFPLTKPSGQLQSMLPSFFTFPPFANSATTSMNLPSSLFDSMATSNLCKTTTTSAPTLLIDRNPNGNANSSDSSPDLENSNAHTVTLFGEEKGSTTEGKEQSITPKLVDTIRD